jgi:hypothetical protein
MFTSHHQNAGINHKYKVMNKSFKYVAKIKHLEKTVTNQNYIHEEIKNEFNSENACNHSLQNLLSSHLLSKNVKINFTSCFVWM